jgi:hypothetical protein
MPEKFKVSLAVEVEADDPLHAAQSAYELLRFSSTRPRRFSVSHPKIQEVIGSGRSLVVELPKENPCGRIPARVDDGEVCCPHCDSENTRYVEDIGQYGPMFVKDGLAVSWGGDLDVDEEGDDPRVLCFGCGRESDLPSGFHWAEAPPAPDLS